MLNIKNLKKTFTNSAKEVFEVINIPEFSLDGNEILAITGDSGSGKTTFLNLISGIVDSDSGEIIIDQTDITKLPGSKKDLFRAKNTGYIFQTFNLLQGFTALENVMLGMMFSGKADKKISETALSKVGLSDKFNSKPSELSVGEQQRVAIARSIVNSPKILLADEPTANLDPVNSDSVIKIIRSLCEENKISLILVSHELDIVSKFQNVRKFSEINVI
ncbi:MAG TPA: ABC transporter ATP-binding protein [Ignavibacteria bacterium]|nr:ABC transporter ATP-binding protein [Ignavibacteria bacterium]